MERRENRKNSEIVLLIDDTSEFYSTENRASSEIS